MGKEVYGADILDKEKHFVVIGSTKYDYEIARLLEQLDFVYLQDYIPFRFFDRVVDRCINGVFVGKGSYFPAMWERFMADKSCREGWGQTAAMIESIGRFTSIHYLTQIAGNHNMDYTSTGAFELFLNGANAKLLKERYRSEETTHRVVIGNDVWIGANVFINASRVKEIGDGAIIGTGAVVIEDVPPYAVVVGTPGKVKRYRYTPEQIECFLRVKWWNWTDEEFNENAELLYNPEMFFEKFMREG